MSFKVYIASPFSKGDPLVNIQRQIETYAELMGYGFYPYAPLLHYPVHMLAPRSWEEWLRQDEAWVEVCDALLRLPGESEGADREVAYAEHLKKPIFYRTLDLVKWAKEQTQNPPKIM